MGRLFSMDVPTSSSAALRQETPCSPASAKYSRRKEVMKNVLEAYSTLVRWNAATCFFQPISHAVAQKRISIHGYILWEEKTKETFVAAFSNLLAKNAFNIAVKLIFICIPILFMLICKENLIVSRNLSNLYSYWIQQKYITWIFHFQPVSAHSVL